MMPPCDGYEYTVHAVLELKVIRARVPGEVDIFEWRRLVSNESLDVLIPR